MLSVIGFFIGAIVIMFLLAVLIVFVCEHIVGVLLTSGTIVFIVLIIQHIMVNNG